MKYQKIFNLKNKVSIVTGATGMLGKEFALGLSQSGSKVAIVDLDRTKARKLAQSITKKYNIKCIGVSCDVSNEEDVSEMVETVEKNLGKISALIKITTLAINIINRPYFIEVKYDCSTLS